MKAFRPREKGTKASRQKKRTGSNCPNSSTGGKKDLTSSRVERNRKSRGWRKQNEYENFQQEIRISRHEESRQVTRGAGKWDSEPDKMGEHKKAKEMIPLGRDRIRGKGGRQGR